MLSRLVLSVDRIRMPEHGLSHGQHHACVIHFI